MTSENVFRWTVPQYWSISSRRVSDWRRPSATSWRQLWITWDMWLTQMDYTPHPRNARPLQKLLHQRMSQNWDPFWAWLTTNLQEMSTWHFLYFSWTDPVHSTCHMTRHISCSIPAQILCTQPNAYWAWSWGRAWGSASDTWGDT